MLTMMRKILTSKWSWPLLGIVILGMAVWGTENIFGGNFGGGMGQAGKRIVTLNDVDRYAENYVRNVNVSGERTITKEEAANEGIIDQIYALRASTVSSMAFADKIGAVATPSSVEAAMRADESVRNPETGQLDADYFAFAINRRGLTPRMYDLENQEKLTLEALRNGASAGLSVPAVLGRLQASYIGEERMAAWFVLDSATLPPPTEPTEEELRKYYTDNLALFAQPERRAIDVLKFSKEDFTGRVEVTEEEIVTLYEAGKDTQYSEPDTRTIVQLTFATEEEAKTAFGRFAGGADASIFTNALTNEVLRGQKDSVTNVAMAETMFLAGRTPGFVYGPSQIGDTWLIARLEEITPGAVYELDLVRDLIRNQLINDRSQAMYYDALGEIDSFIGAGMTLREIGAELGVPVMSYLPVDANGVTDAGRPMMAVIEAGEAFQQAFALSANEVSDRYDSETATYLTRTTQIIDAATPSFEAIQDRVKTAYVANRGSTALQSAADAISARIESGESTLDAEVELASSVLTRLPQPVTRLNAQQAGLPQSAVQGIFDASEGDVITLPTRAGDLILIIQVESVTYPDEAQLTSDGANAAISLAPTIQQDIEAALEAEIRANVNFRPNPAALSAYKASLNTEQ